MKKLQHIKQLAESVLISIMLVGSSMHMSCAQSTEDGAQRNTQVTNTGQSNTIVHQKCGNPHIDYTALQNALNYEASNANSLVPVNQLVKVYFHVLRNDDGSNAAATEANIENEFNQLQSDFSTSGICFINMGLNYINHTMLNNYFDVNMPLATSFLTPFTVEDCIDIFYHNNLPGLGGTAYDIPNTFCSINSSNIGFQTISHEIGHCLGLIHTFETALGIECINGSNSASAGDLILDTDADPWDLPGFVSTGCIYTGYCFDACLQTNFTPPYNNIMSYWQSSACYPNQNFTANQISRMTSFLNSSFVLISIKSPSGYTLGPISYSAGHHMWAAINTLETNGSVNFTGTVNTTLGGGLVILKPGFIANPASDGLILVRASECNSSAIKTGHDYVSEDSFNKVKGKLICYPVPFTDEINLKYFPRTDGNMQIDVADIHGKIVKSLRQNIGGKDAEMALTINLEDIPPGIYLLTVKDSAGSTSEKIIKTQ